MTKTLSDEEMLKEFNSAVSQAVGVATALQYERPPVDPMKVQIGHAYGMNTPHLFLIHTLHKAQQSRFPAVPSTVAELVKNRRSIYTLPNVTRNALDELTECVKKPAPPGEAFALPQLLWCVFPEALSWSKHIHDSVHLDYLYGRGETTLVKDHFEAVVQLLDSLDKLAAAQVKKYEDTAAQGKFYRDHLIHPLRVAWLMETLVGNWGWIYEQSAKDKLKQTYSTSSSGNQFPSGWPASVCGIGRDQSRLGSAGRAASVTAALFHDMHAGTPGACSLSVDALESVSRPVSPFLDYEFARRDLEWELGKGFVSDQGPNVEKRPLVDRAVDRLRESNRAQPTKAEWTTALNGSQTDHGVRAAAELVSLSTEARQAIALHNLFEDKVAKIDLIEAPVAFFLVLCDEAQEWGRWVRRKAPWEYSVLVEKGGLEIGTRCFHATFDFSNAVNNGLAFNFDFNQTVKDKKRNLDRLTIPNELDLSISYSLKDSNGDSTTIFWCRDTRRWETRKGTPQ